MFGVLTLAAHAPTSLVDFGSPPATPLEVGRAAWSEFTDFSVSFDPTHAAAPRQTSASGAAEPNGFIPPASEQWISLGGMYVDTQYLAAGYDGDSSGAVGMSLGAWWWQPSNMGGAAEASWIYDAHHAATLGAQGDVATWDLMLGGRFGVRADDDRWVVYGKGGLLYRIDSGDHLNTKSSDGFGGYLGAGVEMRMGEQFALAPEFMWTFADVAGNSRQFVAGLSFVVRF